MLAVVQYADANCADQLTLTREHHEAACTQFGYRYVVHESPIRSDVHPYWQKPRLLREIIYDPAIDFLVWLDADTYWLGDRPLTPSIELVGMVRHWHYEPAEDHLNAGVIYLNAAHQNAKRLLDHWIDTPDHDHPWHDQWALNKVLKDHRDRYPATELDYEWNSLIGSPCFRKIPPVVAAWHGCHNRAERMKSWIANHKSRFS